MVVKLTSIQCTQLDLDLKIFINERLVISIFLTAYRIVLSIQLPILRLYVIITRDRRLTAQEPAAG